MREIVVLILFSICTIFDLIAYLPQIIQLIKTKSAEDISLSSWMVWIFSETCYLGYVLLESPEIGVIIMTVLNLTLISVTAFLTAFYQYRTKHSKK